MMKRMSGKEVTTFLRIGLELCKHFLPLRSAPFALNDSGAEHDNDRLEFDGGAGDLNLVGNWKAAYVLPHTMANLKPIAKVEGRLRKGCSWPSTASPAACPSTTSSSISWPRRPCPQDSIDVLMRSMVHTGAMGVPIKSVAKAFVPSTGKKHTSPHEASLGLVEDLCEVWPDSDFAICIDAFSSLPVPPAMPDQVDVMGAFRRMMEISNIAVVASWLWLRYMSDAEVCIRQNVLVPELGHGLTCLRPAVLGELQVGQVW